MNIILVGLEHMGDSQNQNTLPIMMPVTFASELYGQCDAPPMAEPGEAHPTHFPPLYIAQPLPEHSTSERSTLVASQIFCAFLTFNGEYAPYMVKRPDGKILQLFLADATLSSAETTNDPVLGGGTGGAGDA